MNKRRIFALLMAVAVTGSLCSCGTNTDQKQPASSQTEESAVPEENKESESSSEKQNQDADNTEETKTEETAKVQTMAVSVMAEYDNILNENYKEDEPSTGSNSYNLMSLSYEYPVILTEGYEVLKASLKDYQKTMAEELEVLKKDGKEAIDFLEPEDYEGACIPWANEYTVTLSRADDTIFSFWQNFYFEEGGAHPSYISNGVNYDTQTGKCLSLDDIVTDKDALYEYVIKELEKKAVDSGYDEDYQETVKKEFYPESEEDGSVNWILTNDGLDIYFNVYEIACYAAGPSDVLIPYADCSAIIKSEYLKTEAATVKQIADRDTVYFDADGDGVEEELSFETETAWDSVNNAPEDEFQMIVNFGEAGNTKSVSQTAYIQFDKAYLMKNEQGRYYLYVQAREYNDWDYLMMFDLSDPAKGPVYMEQQFGDAFYEMTPMDADHFYLSTRMEAIGTTRGYREYKVGEDGIPVSLSDAYNIGYSDEINYSLTAKQDIQGEDGTIKAGEACRVVQAVVDKGLWATTVVVETSAGNKVTLKLDAKTDNSVGECIGGVNVEELFDGVMYAG